MSYMTSVEGVREIMRCGAIRPDIYTKREKGQEVEESDLTVRF